MIVKVVGKNWTVNDKGKALIRYGKGLTCPLHIYNFVRYEHNKIICEYCGKVYDIEGIKN